MQKDLLGHSLPGKDLTDGLTELISSTDISHPESGDLFGLGKNVKRCKEYRCV